MPTKHLTPSEISRLLKESNCPSLALLPAHIATETLAEAPAGGDVGIARRAILRGTYRDRYITLDAFRTSRFGWHGFFSVLDEDGPAVGLLVLRGASWIVYALTDEDADSVLAALVRPPEQTPWPQGAELT
ncbi:hypothetical protein ACWD4V_18265 [Streptomyces tsukubensis]